MATGKLRFIPRACAAIAALAFCGFSAAQVYPAGPVKVIVPSGPGGAHDVVLTA